MTACERLPDSDADAGEHDVDAGAHDADGEHDADDDGLLVVVNFASDPIDGAVTVDAVAVLR